MFIPGWIISIVTFPGIIVHEIAHQLFCRRFRVAVLDVCYFRFGNPVGFVVHETPKEPSQHLWIAVGPFLINSVLGALIALPGIIPVIEFEAGTPLDYFLVWLGLSIAMHAFPSTGDAKGIWSALWSKKTPVKASPLLRLVGTPIVIFIYAGAIGSIVWLDAIYGVTISMLLPAILVRTFA